MRGQGRKWEKKVSGGVDRGEKGVTAVVVWGHGKVEEVGAMRLYRRNVRVD